MPHDPQTEAEAKYGERLREQAMDVVNVLYECAEILEPMEDVNWEGDGPNRAMSVMNDIREIIAKLEAPDA